MDGLGGVGMAYGRCVRLHTPYSYDGPVGGCTFHAAQFTGCALASRRTVAAPTHANAPGLAGCGTSSA